MEDRDDKTCRGEPFTQTNLQDEYETPVTILRTYIQPSQIVSYKENKKNMFHGFCDNLLIELFILTHT